jgi:uncharacterized protein
LPHARHGVCDCNWETAAIIGSVTLAGVCFAVMNALLEEIAFRGVLYNSLESAWGWAVAIVGTGVIFGAFHGAGYPPGVLGGVLAGIYGIMLGWLRWRSGGLAAPVVAHVFADATIFVILAQAPVA